MSLIDEICENPRDVYTWAEWKEIFTTHNIEIMDDDSGIPDTESVFAENAKIAILKCTIRKPVECPIEQAVISGLKEVQKVLTIDEWRAQYVELIRNPPVGRYLGTEDGSKIRIDITCHRGRPPLLTTSIYVPNVVGCHLEWYAQRDRDEPVLSWKMILLPKSRDQMLSKFDITKPSFFVDEIYVVKMAASEQSLLGEVSAY